MRCWRPSPENRAIYDNAERQAEMRAEFDKAFETIVPWSKLELRPKVSHNPLRPSGVASIFNHWAVDITGEGGGTRDTSLCQEFDYTNVIPGQMDPAGCGIF